MVRVEIEDKHPCHQICHVVRKVKSNVEHRRQLNNGNSIHEQMLMGQAASATTTAGLPSIPRQGLFKSHREKGRANRKRSNGRHDNLNNDHVNHNHKGVRLKSVDPVTTKEYECRSNTPMASAPSVPSPTSTVYDMGPYNRCDCPCRKFDITQKSWAVMLALQELYDELCSIQCTSQSCMDWQPSSTTYIINKLVASTATLTSALSSQ